jgi:hypothetical protein
MDARRGQIPSFQSFLSPCRPDGSRSYFHARFRTLQVTQNEGREMAIFGAISFPVRRLLFLFRLGFHSGFLHRR